MAVTSLKTNYWDNSDGLRIYFPDSDRTTRGGSVISAGSNQTNAVIDLTALPTVSSGDQQIILENVVFPLGASIDKVELIVRKETAGSSATLDVGLVKTDRSTEYDFNGLLAAANDFNAGTDVGKVFTFTNGATEAGTKLGIPLTEAAYLTANAATADFTAGIVELRIFWTVPLSADVT
jgi:hypothetical protein